MHRSRQEGSSSILQVLSEFFPLELSICKAKRRRLFAPIQLAVIDQRDHRDQASRSSPFSQTHDHISVEPGPLTISHLTKSVIQTFSPKKQGSNCVIYTSKSTGAEIKPASRYSEIGRIQTAPWGIETVLCLTFCASVMKNVPFLSSSVHSVKRGQF